MTRKGIKYRHAPHLYFRTVKPGDLDSRGRDRSGQGGYCVIVRRADCMTDGRFDFEKVRSAPMHGAHAWGRTNMVYGAPRKYRNYWTRPVYWVENNHVFQGTLRYAEKPEDA